MVCQMTGMTLPFVDINCFGTFSKGQLYVALSRAVDPENLQLRNFEPSMIMKNDTVDDWIEKQRQMGKLV